MAWTIEYSEDAQRQLKKLDRTWQKRVVTYMESGVGELTNPRLRGKALTADLRGLWRYRVGDYRIVCDLRDDRLVVLALAITHRRESYR